MSRTNEHDTEVREAVGTFFRLVAEGDANRIADLFTDEIDWFVPGDPDVLPWTGRCSRRAEIPGYFQALWPVFVPEEGEATLDKLLVDGSDAVALGRITQMVKANGIRYSMDVAFHFTVEQGRIVRLHLYEDTGLVATTVTATA